MHYNGQSAEILSSKAVFGRSVSRIRILATGATLDVRTEELSVDIPQVSLYDLQYEAMAARIKNAVGSQNMLAPYESNVIPLPHQILALEKVMNGIYCRFLLADEVGMGKTIEAGLILKELKLRGIVKRTLIIVPVSAMTQWRDELKKHFNETFHVYDSDFISSLSHTFSSLDSDNDINIWKQHDQLIVSMDALKPLEARRGWSKEKVDEYNKYRIESAINADFDLLIIDECHKVGGSDYNVGRFQMAQTLCASIPSVLLLSATPHRGKSDHFRRLLSLLDSDAFSGTDMPSLNELEPYVVRTEKRQAIDYTGRPLFNKRRTECITCQYDEIKHKNQMQLYEDVTQYVVKGFNLATKTKNSSYAFVMVLFQRMMSSSTQAILDAVQKRAGRLAAEKTDAVSPEHAAEVLLASDADAQLAFDFEAKVSEQIQNTAAAYDTELSELQSLLTEAKHCRANETDVKLKYLLKKLDELKTAESDPDLKFIIFTEFTSTQRMLCTELSNRGCFSCVAINGSMNIDERGNVLKKFKNEAQILVSTDAAGESLNMQFAHIVINYDVPWNPMVIEQRIGRVDRIGQNHEVLAINMMVNNSIDSRVYEVIETKLTQILNELGIDKTSDVLDSTLESDKVNNLYMTSLLDPSRFEKESSNWLDDIKSKLQNYKSTEKALPTTQDGTLSPKKSEDIQQSPLPVWLRRMTTSYLSAKQIKWEPTFDGISVQMVPSSDSHLYTFDTKVSLDNPVPELLTVQSDFMQKLLNEAAPISSDSLIPIVKVTPDGNSAGTFMLWSITAHNEYEAQRKILPVFISEAGDIFASYAQTFWAKLSMGELSAEVTGSVTDSKQKLAKLQSLAESQLSSDFTDMETSLLAHAETLRVNHERAYKFRIQQTNRIGIEQIRTYRIKKYKAEYENWIANYETSRQVVPQLDCMLVVQVAV